MQRHIPDKPKTKNPLALLKAAKKKEQEKRLAAAKKPELQTPQIPSLPSGPVDFLHQQQHQPPPLPLPPPPVQSLGLPPQGELRPPPLPSSSPQPPPLPDAPDRKTVGVDSSTPIITPQFCRPRDDTRASTRVRPGVALVKSVRKQMVQGEETCGEEFLSGLVASRMQRIAEFGIDVADFSSQGRSAVQMNMEDDLAAACIGMMERFDFTYGAIVSVDDLITSASDLPALVAVESMDGVDVVSHAFCLVYMLFLFRATRTKLLKMLNHRTPNAAAVAAIYLRYTSKPKDLVKLLGPLLLCPAQIHISDESPTTMPLSKFIEKLLEADPDFLEAILPKFTPQEEEYVRKSLALEKKVREKKQKMTPEEKEKRRKEEEGARKKKKAETAAERREAAEERRRLFERTNRATLLDGFKDAGTQMAWVAYRSAMTNESSEAVLAQREAHRLKVEMEKHALAVSESHTENLTEIEISKDRQPQQQVLISKQQGKKRKKRVEGDTDAAVPAGDGEEKAKRKKKTVKKTKLQEEAETYLF